MTIVLKILTLKDRDILHVIHYVFPSCLYVNCAASHPSSCRVREFSNVSQAAVCPLKSHY